MTELRWSGREHAPGAEAPFFLQSVRPKAEALGYLEARRWARFARDVHDEKYCHEWGTRVLRGRRELDWRPAHSSFMRKRSGMSMALLMPMRGVAWIEVGRKPSSRTRRGERARV